MLKLPTVCVAENELYLVEFACGQLGFVEFTRRAWLEALLSWQDVTGCYKHHTHTKHRQQETDDNNNPTMRKLMREKVLESES